MKYAIQLSSKYHSDGGVWLGMKHESKEAAKAYAEKEVCFRCNRVEYWPIDDDAYYVGRKEGFLLPRHNGKPA